jgi:transcriptional regulator with XRE-family HTH domain
MENSILVAIGNRIRALREAKSLSQEKLADQCDLHRTYVGGIERGERNITILSLQKIIDILGIGFKEFFTFKEDADDAKCGSSEAALEHAAKFIPEMAYESFAEIDSAFCSVMNAKETKGRDAICDAFKSAVKICPEANISDLWHHLVYRIYLSNRIGTDPEQSWVRTSGEGFELFIQDIYNPIISDLGFKIVSLISRTEKTTALKALNLGNRIGSSKMDLILLRKDSKPDYLNTGCGIVGVIHAKVSLAERVSDDIPASRILMRKGLQSILITLDVKSFPPPNGDLINRGEFGTLDRPSDKRRYIEEHGDFSACFSYNSRTVPSPKRTKSGKKIYTVKSIQTNDYFVNYLRNL